MNKTEVPNVLFDLGISPMAVGVYVYLKKLSAGEGFCCEKQPSICRELNIAPATYIKYRKELARNFQVLKGKPLIYVTERKKRSGLMNLLAGGLSLRLSFFILYSVRNAPLIFNLNFLLF